MFGAPALCDVTLPRDGAAVFNQSRSCWIKARLGGAIPADTGIKYPVSARLCVSTGIVRADYTTNNGICSPYDIRKDIASTF